MDKTIGYVLCCQSPALFLLGLVLFFCYLFRRKRHKVTAVIDLILAILSVGGGVALYFVGMSMDYFNIHNFYQIHTVGWIGLGIVAVLAVIAAVKALARVADERRTEKAAIRAENARLNAEKEAAREAEKAAKAAEKEAEKAARQEAQPIHQAVEDAEALAAEMQSAVAPPSDPGSNGSIDQPPVPDPTFTPQEPQE